MQTFIIHGDDTNKSYLRLRSFIKEARKRKWEVVYLDESPLSIKENIASVNLFGDERFLVHRNFNKVNTKELEWVKKHSDSYPGNVVFYADKSLGKTETSKLPKNVKIEEYKLPVLIWKFLDAFYPGNTKYILKMFHEIVQTSSVEFVFSLLSKHIRDLYWTKVEASSLDYPSWRLSKLKSQSSKYSLNLLENVIEKLAEVDIKSKTGKDSLISLLDFLIIEKLE